MCSNCKDIFNLKFDEKRCSCGKIQGGIFGKDRGSVFGSCYYTRNCKFNTNKAVNNQPLEGQGDSFTAFVIPKKCDTFITNKKN